ELVRRVGGDGTVLVTVEALDGPSGLPAAEALAPLLTADFLAMGPDTIRSVESTVKPTRDYFPDHWPLFVSTAALRKAPDALERRAEEEGPFNLHLDDDAHAAEPPLEKDAPWLDPKEPLPREKVDQSFARYRDGFLVHPDGASLSLVARPAGTALGV